MRTLDMHAENNSSMISFLNSQNFAPKLFKYFSIHLSLKLPGITHLIHDLYIALTLVIFENFLYPVSSSIKPQIVVNTMSTVFSVRHLASPTAQQSHVRQQSRISLRRIRSTSNDDSCLTPERIEHRACKVDVHIL